jgi:hypothetical protein
MATARPKGSDPATRCLTPFAADEALAFARELAAETWYVGQTTHRGGVSMDADHSSLPRL